MNATHPQALKNLLEHFHFRFITLLFNAEPSEIQPVHINFSIGAGAVDTGPFGSIIALEEFTLHTLLLTSPTPGITERMLLHNAWLRLQWEKPVLSMVLYTGDGKHGLPKSIKGHGLNYKIWVQDARDIAPKFFLTSADPNDFKFALLTGRENDKRRRIRDILKGLRQMFKGHQDGLNENIQQLEILSSLRGEKVTQQVMQEAENFFKN